MNNKGFMMAEVIVVSSVILVTLVALYTSYNKIFALYNQRVNYYNVNTLYELALVRDNDYYGDSSSLNSFKLSGEVVNEFNDKAGVTADRTLFYINKIQIESINTTDINVTFKDYIDFLKTSIDYEKKILVDGIEYSWDEMLIMEKCVNGTKNCTYAYLEIPTVS